MINTNVSLDKLNEISKGTMLEHIDIQIIELGDDFIKGTMPVDNRTCQPMGLLHGGASLSLIESLGSIGSSLIVDMKECNIVGIEINANHIGSIKKGIVIGTARILHCGRTTHIWQVEIRDEKEKLICMGRLTTLVIKKNK